MDAAATPMDAAAIPAPTAADFAAAAHAAAGPDLALLVQLCEDAAPIVAADTASTIPRSLGAAATGASAADSAVGEMLQVVRWLSVEKEQGRAAREREATYVLQNGPRSTGRGGGRGGGRGRGRGGGRGGGRVRPLTGDTASDRQQLCARWHTYRSTPQTQVHDLREMYDDLMKLQPFMNIGEEYNWLLERYTQALNLYNAAKASVPEGQ